MSSRLLDRRSRVAIAAAIAAVALWAGTATPQSAAAMPVGARLAVATPAAGVRDTVVLANWGGGGGCWRCGGFGVRPFARPFFFHRRAFFHRPFFRGPFVFGRFDGVRFRIFP